MIYLLMFLVSLIIATFFDHVVHWALHQRWAGIAHRAHMEHHLELYPPGNLSSDTYRVAKWYHRGALLFTPPTLAILGAAGGLVWLTRAPWWVLAVFAGFVVSFALVNDWFHDSFHVRKHPLMRFRWYRKLRKLHYLHHNDMATNFGIVTLAWDVAFGTATMRR